MSTAHFRKNLGMTPSTAWNAEPETSTKAPKRLVDQVAKTATGRAMQAHAELVRDQVADTTQREFEMTESPVYPFLKSDLLEVDLDGTVVANENADSGSLKAMKESLLDIRADAEDRELIRSVLRRVDQAIEKREIVEAPEKIIRALAEMKDLQDQVRGAIDRREFNALSYLNEKLLLTAFTLLDGFEKMRASNPDDLMGLTEKIRSSQGDLVNQFKSALIEFVRTHNDFSLSEQEETALEYGAQKDSMTMQKRNGRPSFRQALHTAYQAPKKPDDPYTFLQRVTRIPAERFKQIVEREMKKAS